MAANMSNYLGILKWSLQYNDGTSPSPAKPMDEETKKWLLEVMDSIKSPVDEMKILMKVLEAPTEETPTETKDEVLDKQVEACENLLTYLEDIDLASDFVKLGGMELLHGLMSSHFAALRTEACETFAAVVQNHPKMQDKALSLDVMDTLMGLLDQDTFQPDPSSANQPVKALLGLSCLVRTHDAASTTFVKDRHGVQVLLQLLANEHPVPKTKTKLVQKASFLLEYFANQYPLLVMEHLDDVAPLFLAIDVLLASEDQDVSERAIKILNGLASHPHVRATLVSQTTWDNYKDVVDGKLAENVQDEGLREVLQMLKDTLLSDVKTKADDPVLLLQ